jgi:hypothetical protein
MGELLTLHEGSFVLGLVAALFVVGVLKLLWSGAKLVLKLVAVAALVAAPNPEFQRSVERMATSLLVDLAGHLQLRVGDGRSLRLAYLGAVRAHIARARRQLTLPFATVS